MDQAFPPDYRFAFVTATNLVGAGPAPPGLAAVRGTPAYLAPGHGTADRPSPGPASLLRPQLFVGTAAEFLAWFGEHLPAACGLKYAADVNLHGPAGEQPAGPPGLRPLAGPEDCRAALLPGPAAKFCRMTLWRDPGGPAFLSCETDAGFSPARPYLLAGEACEDGVAQLREFLDATGPE